ncbi:hypothetical protein WJ89_23790 [Burkholderia ubonensis]|nr:hypothetical protein WJ64_20165 [Burkholderia ubonensis]KVP37750.1 hypothetical protein WJ89_23790 [Burkholderia ubonensis]KVQ91382.1 hypothetical protein WK09_11935 [Burkholderia ubonensis]KVR08101.1 hypothetical protein WK12_23190 [Burkholderia ubonensis]KVR44861.1 hypothetical protein WK18_15215 [Burkholderia ubonensis]
MRKRSIVGGRAVRQFVSIDARDVNHAAELGQRERVGSAALLQLYLGRTNKFVHEQCAARVYDFEDEVLLER